jgi:hypothetical protein
MFENKSSSVGVMVAAVLGFGCIHTLEEKRKADVERVAEVRISAMEDNISKVVDTKNQQLTGEPRDNLNASIEELKQITNQAKSELKELKSRDTKTWLDKKVTVDQKLAEMDRTYSEALGIITSH